MKILVNLIGGQPAPNFIAAKEICPDKILYICSKDSHNVMERLSKTLSIETVDPHITVNAYDFDEIYNKFLRFIETNSGEIILNLTGGTKIMSLACYEAARMHKIKSIYVDSENHKLYNLGYDEIEFRPLSKKVSISDHFNMHGFINIKQSRDLNFENELKTKFDNFIDLGRKQVSMILKLTIEILKYKRANKAKWMKEDVRLKKGSSWFSWKNNTGIIHYQIGEVIHEFQFTNDDFIDYHNGKWFESLVKKKLKESRKYDEIQSNLEIYSENNVLLNELDLVTMKDDKLTIIECKSGGLNQDVLNKLKAIKELLGKYSNIVLVTYFPLKDDNENNKVIRQKLVDYGIKNYYYPESLVLKEESQNVHL